MDQALHLKAAQAVKSVYAGNCHNIGSTEWASTIIEHEGTRFQVLAIGGSNEWIDWFWNLLLISWDGVKIGNYLSAHLIHSGTWGDFEWLRQAKCKVTSAVKKAWNYIRRKPEPVSEPIPVFVREPNLPLVLAVHSKSGATGTYFIQKFGGDLCLGFCPARGHRKAIPLANTIIYIDPDDPVPKLAALSFEHPVCEVVILPDDPGWRIGDHPIDHIIEFLEG